MKEKEMMQAVQFIEMLLSKEALTELLDSFKKENDKMNAILVIEKGVKDVDKYRTDAEAELRKRESLVSDREDKVVGREAAFSRKVSDFGKLTIATEAKLSESDESLKAREIAVKGLEQETLNVKKRNEELDAELRKVSALQAELKEKIDSMKKREQAIRDAAAA